MSSMGWSGLGIALFGSCAAPPRPDAFPPQPEPTESTSTTVSASVPPCGPDAVQPPPSADARGYDTVGPIWIQVLPDVTGDGLQDAFVAFEAWPRGVGTSDVHALLAPGPLTQVHSLFDHAAAALGGLAEAADLDGDGDQDLWWEGCAVVGPLPESVDDAVVLDFPGRALDVDRDGVAELLEVRRRTDRPPVTHIVQDGFPSWTNEPRLVVDPSCADPGGGWLDSPYVRPIESLPDLDLDGVPELFWGGFWYAYRPLECANAWLDATATGTLDPVENHLAFASDAALPVGDQNGDGVIDAIVNDRLLAGPLTLAEPALVGAAALASVQPGVVRVPFDLTGDGIGDFLSTYEHVLLSGGVQGGVVTGEPLAEVPQGSAASFFYAEQSAWHLTLGVDEEGTIELVPVHLGKATPVGLVQ